MEIAQLQAFLAVAEHRSFSGAAVALFITQPAVSKRINTLEGQIDRPLFDRLGKQVTLTPAGRALLPSARRVLAEIANCEAELQSLDGRVAGPLALGTSHHIGLRRLPELLRHYIQTYPEVEVDLQLSVSEEALDSVMDNSLELAVITLPHTTPSGICSEILWVDPLEFCCAIEHPLASQQSVSAEELCQHTALLPSRGTATRRLLEEQLQPLGAQLGRVLETNYLETNKGLAQAGLGWALLPTTMLDPSLRRLQIKHINLSRNLGLVRRQGRTLSAAAEAMLALLRSHSR
ncbi:MAG: LysR family transcriptional regulator [Granulosicoccaceae bacterium]